MLDIIAATDAYNAARGTQYTTRAVTRWCKKGQLTTARYVVETGEDGRPRAKWEIDETELLSFTPPPRGRRAKTMDYQIKLVVVEGFADADGIYENRDGAWLGECDGEKVMPYSDEDGDFVPAPTNWRELVIRELN